MIILNTTLRSLEIDLQSASTSPLDILVNFTQIRTADGQKGLGCQTSQSNGTSDVTILTAPVSGYIRIVDTISIHNPIGNASEIVRVYYDESGTERNILYVTLAAGDTLFYEDE